jgi:hypothetical protein
LFDTAPPFRTHIATRFSSQLIAIAADATTPVGFFVAQNPAPSVKPQLIGMNGELSTVALPLRPGRTFTIYVAGEGVDEIAATNIATSSPLVTVNPGSLNREEFDLPYPVISFQITVARETPAGEYSLVMQSADGELVYLAGALTID